MSEIEVEHDPEANAIYVRLADAPYDHTEELDTERNLDYAADGTVIGVELLNVSRGVDLRDVPSATAIAEALRQRNIRVLV